MFEKLDVMLTDVNSKHTLRYDCKPSTELCTSRREFIGLPAFVEPSYQGDELDWQVRTANLCSDFWRSPSLKETLQSAEPVSGVDLMPAPYALLPGLLPIEEEIESMLLPSSSEIWRRLKLS